MWARGWFVRDKGRLFAQNLRLDSWLCFMRQKRGRGANSTFTWFLRRVVRTSGRVRICDRPCRPFTPDTKGNSDRHEKQNGSCYHATYSTGREVLAFLS